MLWHGVTHAMQEEEFLKRYLEYCRVKCSPRLTPRAAANLSTDYVEIRQEVRFLYACCFAINFGSPAPKRQLPCGSDIWILNNLQRWLQCCM